MDFDNFSNLYFKWMCSVAFPDEHIRSHYNNILTILNNMPFESIGSIDINRVNDGLNLRYHFCYISNIPYDIFTSYFNKNTCSILEMMISLSIKCENSIMSNNAFGDRTSRWFNEMFNNLNLTDYRDEEWTASEASAVKWILNGFIYRQYDDYGNGNIFKFKYPIRDLNKIELWDQLNYYMSEIVENDLRIS